MHFYQLDDRESDKAFLEGKPVTCKAVIKNEENELSLKKEDPIIVVLTNGKKYKGIVQTVNVFPLNQYCVGELIIVRSGLKSR